MRVVPGTYGGYTNGLDLITLINLSPQDRFKVPYMHCGCPLPSNKIGQRLSKLVHFYMSTQQHLIPPTRGDILAATHPSEHDAMADVHYYRNPSTSAKAQSDRKRKVAFRVARDASRANGALPGMGVKKEEALDPTTYGHTMPFMIPVPYNSRLDAACAEHSGHVHSTSGSQFQTMIAACWSMPKPYVPPPRVA
ncbi:hypothetical protein H0H87_005487, partial [Tephrocybe sp. NHM501043]